MDKGFYIAARQEEVYGLSIALVYIKAEKDIQLSLQIGDPMLAIGYVF